MNEVGTSRKRIRWDHRLRGTDLRLQRKHPLRWPLPRLSPCSYIILKIPPVIIPLLPRGATARRRRSPTVASPAGKAPGFTPSLTFPGPRRCPGALAHPHLATCLTRVSGPAHPAGKEALRETRQASPARRGAPPARPRSRPAGHRRQSSPARTLAMRIMRLAMARSPWWFCPISAMMKHGCSPPTRRPGHSSNSRDMMAAAPPPARNCADSSRPPAAPPPKPMAGSQSALRRAGPGAATFPIGHLPGGGRGCQASARGAVRWRRPEGSTSGRPQRGRLGAAGRWTRGRAEPGQQRYEGGVLGLWALGPPAWLPWRSQGRVRVLARASSAPLGRGRRVPVPGDGRGFQRGAGDTQPPTAPGPRPAGGSLRRGGGGGAGTAAACSEAGEGLGCAPAASGACWRFVGPEAPAQPPPASPKKRFLWWQNTVSKEMQTNSGCCT